MGGAAAPPKPPPFESLNHCFFEHPISRENAVTYDILCNLCNLCVFVCMHFFGHHRGSHPRQPSRCFLYSIAPFLIIAPLFESSLLRTKWGGGVPPPPHRDLIEPLFESSLPRTSWGGGAAAPPNPPATL